jgi:hypothetical protein
MPKPLLMDQDSLDDDLSMILSGVGWDVAKTSLLGLGRAPDHDVLAFATAGRTVYTANYSDYARLHAAWMREGRTHAGIIMRTVQQQPIGNQVRALYAIDATFSLEQMTDAIIYLENYLNPS